MATKKIVPHRFIRLIIAHLLCAIHMGLSIYVLYMIKIKTQLYFIPMFGTILFGIEAIISLACYRCKEYFRGFSILIFVYAATIIASIWVLELHRINQLKHDTWKIVPIFFPVAPYQHGNAAQRPWVNPKEILKNFKYIWSQVEIQVFLFLLLVLRALLPKQDSISYFGKTDLLFKYFATGMDSLDFIDLLSYPQLYINTRLVYATLVVWSVSCLQFVIYVPEVTNHRLKELHSLLTNSLLITFLMDIPFLVIRLYAIFGCGSHDYTSYFFVFKNILLILLQIARIQAIIVERNLHRKDELAKLTYKPQSPFDTRAKPHQLSIPLSNNNNNKKNKNKNSGGAKIIYTNYAQNYPRRQPGDGKFINANGFSNV
ncbi:unnamed protein product [Rotaria socialis]|uniref:Uncharacterized protein n=1 Tax=Rotaria socialis TaxID=392032 RepID=A0A818WEM4_9BILA|nr:unnamed protein product [Rotaria socialis]CAF3724004.1 unnamed protein product [Rotaria socialis]CAF4180786.1 unnamed protein product [Rotaria socialis]CAF4495268.1 unnamed protein product [Rotaria socialis]